MSRSDNYIAELEKKVERLENCIKCFHYDEYSNSIEESEASIKKLYTGVADEEMKTTIKECMEAYK